MYIVYIIPFKNRAAPMAAIITVINCIKNFFFFNGVVWELWRLLGKYNKCSHWRIDGTVYGWLTSKTRCQMSNWTTFKKSFADYSGRGGGESELVTYAPKHKLRALNHPGKNKKKDCCRKYHSIIVVNVYAIVVFVQRVSRSTDSLKKKSFVRPRRLILDEIRSFIPVRKQVRNGWPQRVDKTQNNKHKTKPENKHDFHGFCAN